MVPEGRTAQGSKQKRRERGADKYGDDEKCPGAISVPMELLTDVGGEWAIKEGEVTCGFEPIEGGVMVDVRKI